MNSSDVVSQRLDNQKLSSSEFRKPVEVVRWLGAVQAQDFNAAKWALAMRMRQATDAGVEAAYNDGQILRTHVMRPTWHFVAPEDLRWLLQLTAPRVNVRCSGIYGKLGLDARFFKRSHRAITNALKGGKHLTRAELKAALNRSGLAADDPLRLAYIILRAELDGVVCSGARKGKQFTYALLEEWVPAAAALTPDESLAKLTQRYFTSHGPATLPDFVWWSGLTTNDARRGIALLESDLDRGAVQETVYWSAASATPVERVIRNAHLLPPYDEYTVAYKDRQLLFDVPSRLTNSDALGPTVLVDERIVGTWKGTLSNGSVYIAVTPARTLTKQQKLAITKAAERYAAFLDLPLNVSFR